MTRTSRTLAVTLLSAASLTLATPALAAPASARVDPAQHSCSATLARAQQFPGTIPLHGSTYRLVSDAFVSHLAGLPSCLPGV